jgi:hypothetical protein
VIPGGVVGALGQWSGERWAKPSTPFGGTGRPTPGNTTRPLAQDRHCQPGAEPSARYRPTKKRWAEFAACDDMRSIFAADLQWADPVVLGDLTSGLCGRIESDHQRAQGRPSSSRQVDTPGSALWAMMMHRRRQSCRLRWSLHDKHWGIKGLPLHLPLLEIRGGVQAAWRPTTTRKAKIQVRPK